MTQQLHFLVLTVTNKKVLARLMKTQIWCPPASSVGGKMAFAITSVFEKPALPALSLKPAS